MKLPSLRPRSLRSKLLVGSIVPILLIAFVAYAAYAGVAVNAAAADRIRQGEQAVSEANRLVKDAIDAETGLRGFIITGSDDFLDPYRAAEGDYPATAGRLRALVAATPAQVALVDHASQQFADWQRVIGAPEIAQIRAGQAEQTRALVATGEGRQRIDALRATVDQLVASVESVRDQQAARASRVSGAIQFIAIAGLGLAVGIALFVAVYLSRRVGRRVTSVADAAEAMAAGDLDRRVEETGDTELATMGRAFNAMADRISGLLAAERGRGEALQDAVRELETFSYSVSHDLRAPLRSFDGYSQILLEDYGDRLDEEAHDLLRRMRSASQRMGQLIDDLLALSRIGRADMSIDRVDLSAMAAEIVDELRRRDPERTVDVSIEPGLVAVADRRLVRIGLENLLGNAWKFTARRSDGRIELGREPSPASSNGQHPVPQVFVVRDNGVGFDMAYADKLFGPFQRLHPQSDFPGTGIGLATVARVVHRHGGTIAADAEIGRGATFRFTLEPGEANAVERTDAPQLAEAVGRGT